MMEGKLNEVVEKFFEKLPIKNHYYSLRSKQPILLIGEKDLYDAIRAFIRDVTETLNFS